MKTERTVAIRPCSTYDPAAVREAVEESWEVIGIPDLQDKLVLVKPNILSDKGPQKAVTTHPAVVEAVCSIILERGGKPVVGDSPAIQTPGFAPRQSGIREVCDRLSVPWVDFTKKTVTVYHGSESFTVASIATEADYIVNLPKMKTHQFMFYTGAVKNLFGLIPSLSKSPYHLRYRGKRKFARMILDLYQAVPVNIHIMDAIVAMEGPGPGNGTPKKVGAILASTDGLALDTAAVTIMGERPHDIPILAEALRRRVVHSINADDLTYPLSRPEDVAPKSYVRIKRSSPTHVPSLAVRILRSWFGKKQDPPPVIMNDACILCRKCEKICPADAISGSSSLTIDHGVCIRCYCCHEVCPADAIEIMS